jgi:hypothetical protein
MYLFRKGFIVGCLFAWILFYVFRHYGVDSFFITLGISWAVYELLAIVEILVDASRGNQDDRG